MNKLALSLLLALSSTCFAATDGTFIVHEWGTFTSVQGSNGFALGGMAHEEEQLPSFVVGRDVLSEPFHRRCKFSKSLPVCDDEVIAPVIHASDVTQKMETPVLYFHSDRERKVSVRVDFPHGIISQYYPAPTTFFPADGYASKLAYGMAIFDVNLSMASLALPSVAQSSVYGPARNVSANFLTSNGQNEKFIFYRGLGNFQTELNVTSKDGALSVYNAGNNYVPAIFLLNVTPQGSAVKSLGGLTNRNTLTVSEIELKDLQGHLRPQSAFESEASTALNTALRQAGLYKDEAEAMTNTWKKSYFRNPGLRVLYVLSRGETDNLLPLGINPQPQEVQRALVGRIEVLTDREEKALLAALAQDMLYPGMLGRFAEPKLRRLLQLTQDQALTDKLNAMIATLK